MVEGPRRSQPASVALCSAMWLFRCRRSRGTTRYDPYHSLRFVVRGTGWNTNAPTCRRPSGTPAARAHSQALMEPPIQGRAVVPCDRFTLSSYAVSLGLLLVEQNGARLNGNTRAFCHPPSPILIHMQSHHRGNG